MNLDMHIADKIMSSFLDYMEQNPNIISTVYENFYEQPPFRFRMYSFINKFAPPQSYVTLITIQY